MDSLFYYFFLIFDRFIYFPFSFSYIWWFGLPRGVFIAQIVFIYWVFVCLLLFFHITVCALESAVICYWGVISGCSPSHNTTFMVTLPSLLFHAAISSYLLLWTSYSCWLLFLVRCHYSMHFKHYVFANRWKLLICNWVVSRLIKSSPKSSRNNITFMNCEIGNNQKIYCYLFIFINVVSCSYFLI